MGIQEKVKEVKDIIQKIAGYFSTSSNFDDSDKEMGAFFTEQLLGVISGAGELLKAVLKGHSDSLEQYHDFVESAKGLVPQITYRLEKDKGEKGGLLKNQLENALNECFDLFSLELNNSKLE